MPAALVPLLMSFSLSASILIMFYPEEKPIWLKRTYLGLLYVFFGLACWLLAYNFVPWEYHPDKIMKVRVVENKAVIVVNETLIDVSRIFHRNFQEGDEIVLHQKVPGPYLGLYSVDPCISYSLGNTQSGLVD